jgi:MerC mercury resistance protein
MVKAIARRALWIDSMGAWVSLGCALHCAAIPMLFGVLPLLGLGFLVHDTFEKIFLTFSVALAFGSLCWGYRLHRRWSGFLILASGLSLIVIGRNFVTDKYEVLFVVAGVVFLAGAHILNRYLCLRCHDDSD